MPEEFWMKKYMLNPPKKATYYARLSTIKTITPEFFQTRKNKCQDHPTVFGSYFILLGHLRLHTKLQLPSIVLYCIYFPL